MILGLQMYGPVANWKGDLKDLIRAAKAIGYDRLEPCLCLDGSSDNPSFLSMEQFKELAALMKELGLETISAHVVCLDLEACLESLYELSDNYGIKQFVVGLTELTEVSLQERAFVLRTVSAKLSAHGARILLHNGKADMATKLHGRTAYEYLCDICLGKVGMQFDTGWAARGGVDPAAFMERNMHRIESLHYKDFDMREDTDIDTPIGSGTLDNELFMQYGRAAGIPMFVDADVYHDVAGDAAQSYHYLMDIGQQRAHSVSYLNIYDTETGKVKILGRFPGVIEAPNWLPGEDTLIYNSEGAIYRYDIATGVSTKIESGAAKNCNNDHVVSFDKKEIAVSSDYGEGSDRGSRILILPLSGGEARLVTGNAPSYLHGWSPDGKELSYCAFRTVDGKMSVDIYTIPAEGGEEKRLTFEGFNDGPEYSPDGKHIWFISTRTGLMQVYRMNRDGSDIVQMTCDERNNWFGHVSPDCSKVVNIAYRKGDLQPGEHLPNMQVELWMMDYDGSNRRRILEFFGGQGSINVNSWSGDSRYFAFVSYDIEK